MRYLIKGGGWKNYEDEILKAAVMKYGLNQWSRISSLLVRKSAKQCKARWYEWLDPSIKKTEWTKEEEEKLLHLSKIFPSQWRTIAPIVGRTPAQCVEHYEKLLDLAQGRDSIDDNDPRRLKPGEIDPAPETRPARPDPIDFDDDEREMIAEARVRLANTKGKKAKRKAREKLIERARIQAMLQKERELKMAGLHYNVRRNMKKLLDYNVEIPFQRVPFHVIEKPGAEEDPKPKPHVGNISLQGLEGARRDEEEDKLRKLDQKKIKKLKELDLPTAIENTMKHQNLLFLQSTKLNLIEPQLTDGDLENLAKLTKMQSSISSDFYQESTKALVGNYSIRDPTPARTPRYTDAVMSQARSVIAGRDFGTPYAENDDSLLQEKILKIRGIEPNRPSNSTPNLLKLRITHESPFIHSTHSQHSNSVLRNKSSMRKGAPQTPMRDEFKINTADGVFSAWEEIKPPTTEHQEISEEEKQALVKEMVLKNLKNLPPPKNNYDIDTLENITIEEGKYIKNEKLDQEDINLLLKKRKYKEKQKLLSLRTKVIQKGLPRPKKLPDLKDLDLDLEDRLIIMKEMKKVISRDMYNYPFHGMEPPEEVESDDDDDMLTVSELKKARETIAQEALQMMINEEEMIKTQISYSDVKIEQKTNMLMFAQKQAKTLKILKEKASTLNQTIVENQSNLDVEIIQKNKEILKLIQEIIDLDHQIAMFKNIEQHERKISSLRLDNLKTYVKQLEDKESKLQEIYLLSNREIKN